MTTREFFAIVAASDLADDVKAFATASIEKLDSRKASRSNKPSKTQVANAPIKEALLKYLAENDGQFTEGDLGTALDITHNKAGSLARQLVAEGKVTSADVKFPKIGRRKVYSIVKE